MLKIDFEQKRWIKSGIHCNQLGTKQEAIQTIFDVKMKILNEFLKQKTQLHDENDPEGLMNISKVFDIRWWKLKINEIESENQKTELFDYVQDQLEEGKKFIKGEKLGPVISDLKLVVIKCVEVPIMLSKAANESTIN